MVGERFLHLTGFGGPPLSGHFEAQGKQEGAKEKASGRYGRDDRILYWAFFGTTEGVT